MRQQMMLPLIPDGATRVNDAAAVLRVEDACVYFTSLQPVYRHEAKDRRGFYLTCCMMMDSGLCRERGILKTFGVPRRTLDNWQDKFKKGGIKAFFIEHVSRRGPTILTPEVIAEAQLLLDQGCARAEVAAALGIKSCTLRKAINQNRLVERERAKGTTKSERTPRDAAAAEGIGTACTRVDERLLAAVGMIAGAATQFPASLDVPRGGVLRALPPLLENGLLTGVDKLLGAVHGYYTQFHILLLLSFMALCRIRTVENFFWQTPGELGILLGLDRSPEARCLRMKMDEMAGKDNAGIWAAELSRHWMDADPDSCGYLYVDGHVNVYRGGQTKLPRRHVSRQRLCLRGVSSY